MRAPIFPLTTLGRPPPHPPARVILTLLLLQQGEGIIETTIETTLLKTSIEAFTETLIETFTETLIEPLPETLIETFTETVIETTMAEATIEGTCYTTVD